MDVRRRTSAVNLSRREALRLLTTGSAGVIILACVPANSEPHVTSTTSTSPTQPVESTASVDAPKPQDFGIDSDITLTSNEEFYHVSYQPGDPAVDPSTWLLRVSGLVDNPLELSLADIKAMPPVIEMRTLECISNPVGGSLIGNAVWKGVACAEILDMAGVQPRAREVKMKAADDYHTAIPLELAMHPRSLLAYEMNGEPLPVRHGFPLRCLWPGRYGQKQPKWLTQMELIAGHHLGHWESQGWSNEAVIQPNSQIREPAAAGALAPESHFITGLAFAGGSGVARVEVSADDGKTWHEAERKQAPAPFTPYVWTEWSIRWEQPEPGSHTLIARVTDGAGATQQRSRRRLLLGGTFPNGTNNMHEVRVTVRRS
ncbi:MAG: molybdopterin-dependent oxidoreductase [Anaerolineae bacterium]